VFRNSSTGKNDSALHDDLQFGLNKKQGGAIVNNETLDISYDWNMKFNTAMGGPASYQLDSLVSWTDIDNDGIKYYSGTAIYERAFTLPGKALENGTKAYVVFEDIQEMVHVFVNGEDCGIVWTPPFKANITPYLKDGQNKITVKAVNAWNNRIVGDLKNPSVKYSNTNLRRKFRENGPLLKSGLMGKGEILLIKSVK
jgi:hypothetical protein